MSMQVKNQRLKELREVHLKWSQIELANQMGISDQTISTIEQGGTFSQKTEKLLFEKVNVNESWLETGEGLVFKDNKRPVFSNNESTSPWRDEAYNAVKQQAEEWKRKFEQLFESYLKITTSGKPNALVLPGRSRNAGAFTGVRASA